jgi:hypothetical protein
MCEGTISHTFSYEGEHENMKTLNVQRYECEVCKTMYATAEEAENCEKSHTTCDCEKGFKYYRLGYLEPGYDRYVSSNINWGEKEIQLIYNYHGSVSVHDRRPIKYCPFCGKEL